MRIISLLPAATEIIHFLGAKDQLVGEKLIKTIVDDSRPSNTINKAVLANLGTNQPLYIINQDFASLKPDLVITQQLCQVCAITPINIQAAIRDCQPQPELLSLHPHSIQDILTEILKVGEVINQEQKAKSMVKTLQKRMAHIKKLTKNLKKKPKVYCMEWLDPPYSGGHWVPEQVEIAGGRDELANKGADSTRIMWQKIANYDPDTIVLMPCGFSIERAKRELYLLKDNPVWSKFNAVKSNQVYLVNGPAYFNSSGPGVIDGIELLATIFHPEIFKELRRKFDLEDIFQLSSRT